jgi:hypothetical protein
LGRVEETVVADAIQTLVEDLVETLLREGLDHFCPLYDGEERGEGDSEERDVQPQSGGGVVVAAGIRGVSSFSRTIKGPRHALHKLPRQGLRVVEEDDLVVGVLLRTPFILLFTSFISYFFKEENIV